MIESTRPILIMDGLTCFKYMPIPVIVPDVPIPAQKTLICGSCEYNCGPVHLICAPQFYGPNCKLRALWFINGRRSRIIFITYQVIDILIGIICIVSLLGQFMGTIDAASVVSWLWLGWPTEYGSEFLSETTIGRF